MSANPPSPEAFVCQRCSQCCQGQGGIFLAPAEVGPAARLVGLDEEEFVRRHLEPVPGGWEVAAGADGACSLLGPRGCRIHQAKPAICRRWPFFSALLADPQAFQLAKEHCPGLRPEAGHADFLAQAARLGHHRKEEPS
jgi:hypothetical protein